MATNGNLITVRVTDLAGNTATTNFNVILNYATATNPPVVKLIWPLAGMAVCGSNCTMREALSDETGSLVATVVNGDGTTNVIEAVVERNGMFWLENVPLNGTNQITLQATDAAGNVAVTNFTLNPSTINLQITSLPSGDDLWNPHGPVAGVVNDPNVVVTVNGANAAVATTANADGSYSWSAEDAPIYGTGTANAAPTANVNGST